MSALLIKLIVAMIITEAVTEIVAESQLFNRIRKFVGGERDEGLDGKHGMKGVLVWCGYCQSVWFGVGAAFLLCIKGAVPDLPGWAETLIWGMVIHRASNVWHEAISRFLNRVPFSMFVRAWTGKEPQPDADVRKTDDRSVG